MGIILLGLIALSCSSVHNITRPFLQGIPDENDATENYFRTVQNNTFHPAFQFLRKIDNAGTISNILIEEKPLDASAVHLNEFVKQHNTLSFAIIRNDTLLYEYYAPNLTPQTNVTSFSIAKSFVAMLIGIAIDDGRINSVNDPIIDYIPELQNEKGFNIITIKNLLQHTSGIKFSKQMLNPWSDQFEFYYTNNLRKHVLDIDIKNLPGQYFDYNSKNTMLLALILERSTGMSVSKYLEKKIWTQIDMEAPATWNTDRNDNLGIEKVFCCLNARTMDFARFGRLLLNNGNWNGKQIIPKAFICDATTPSLKDGGKITYGYNMGIGPKKYGSFFPIGLFGQLIYIYPERNIIIVRFGKGGISYNPNYWKEIMLQIIDQL